VTLADLREALHDVLSEGGADDRPRLYSILRAMAREAERGNVRAAALLLDRAFGAPQAVPPDPGERHTIYIDVTSGDEAEVEQAADASPAPAD